MKILVYGSGAVGSLVGACLARAGAEVVLLARPVHAAAVARAGLRVTGPDGTTQRVWLRAQPEMPAGERFEVVLVTVKGYDTERVAPTLDALLSTDGRVVCLQNGVGHEELLAGSVGPGRVVAGVCTASASLKEPGWVVQHTWGGLGLASWDGARVEDLARAFRRGGWKVRSYPDARSLKWSKLLLNVVGNATGALLDLPPGKVYADPELFRLERRMLLEAVAVGSALGVRWVDLPGFPVRALVRVLPWPAWLVRRLLLRAVATGRGSKMPSLWYDLARGRTEVAYLNGAVVRWGAAVGVPTPVNALLTRLVEDLRAGRGLRARSRDFLLQAVGN